MELALDLITSHLFFFFFTFFYIFCNQANSVPLNECNSASNNTPEYFLCKAEERGAQCGTYAVLRSNSYYSSLANLSLYLGLTPKAVTDATGFSPTTKFLPKEQPLLLPIDCKCNSPASGFFQAELVRTTAKGDSLHSISESLEGLTTCKAVADKNPSSARSLPLQELAIGSRITVPIKCSCPTKLELGSGTRFLVSYPVRAGDTLSSLASYFKVTKEAIIAANNNRLTLKGYYKPPGTQPLVTYSTVLIPVNKKLALGSLAGPPEPKLGAPGARPPLTKNLRKKKKKKVMIAAISVVVAATAAITVTAVFITLQRKGSSDKTPGKKKNKQSSISSNKLDIAHQFNLSIRTTSEKKLSFEGSQSTIDGQLLDATPHKTLESYSVDEINRATDDFDSHNLVEGPVYHGRIRGKDVAVKCTPTESFPKVDFTLFQDSMHNHPNILRLYGACFSETTPQSFLVFEYAKNGSLKDWIHGGLAVKSQFIASCSCFLTLTQRLRICLDVALGMQYMHQIMSPPYVHRNIKTRNVFLDEEFHAKMGNFGMARCVEDDNCSLHLQFSEKWNSWNKAYMAPELRKRGSVSTGVDIYAYGVVLLEVLSGKKPVTYSDEKVVLLSEEIKAVLGSESGGEARGWMDSTLGESYSLEGAVAVARLAKACVEDDPRMRPNAGEIVEKLSGLLEVAAVTVISGGSGERRLENEGSSKPLVKAADWTNNTAV